MELFKSPVINKDDLFQSHKVKRSGTSIYRNIMSKDTAYSKLSRSNKNIQSLIDDRRAVINILENKQKKYPYRAGRYQRQLGLARAERDALQAKIDQKEKEKEDLIRFTTSHAGRVVPADAITSFIGGRTPLPYRLTSPEIVQEANTINVPELSTQPISIPTQPLALGTSQSGLALPSVSSGGVPFQPSGTQAPIEAQTGQGTPQAVEAGSPPLSEAGSLTEEEARKETGLYPSPSELSDIPVIRGQPEYKYRSRVEAMKDKLVEEYYKKNPNKYGFVSSDTEPERPLPPRRKKKKEPKPEEVVIKQEEQEIASEAEEEPKGKEKEVVSEAEEEVKTNGSDYLSEKVKKVNAKEVEKYLKNYRIEFKNRKEFTEKFPRGNYVRYLNDLVKNDPEFWRYHNVVKKK